METTRFDLLAKRIFLREASRRGAIQIGATSLAAISLIQLAPESGARNRRGKRKKRFKGDARCKQKLVLSKDGICRIIADPELLPDVECGEDCFCARTSKGARACISDGPPLCDASCETKADCGAGQVCVVIAGCCQPTTLVRTCADVCPRN